MLYKVLNKSEDKIRLMVPKDISHLLGETILLKRREEIVIDWLPENKDDSRLIINPIIEEKSIKKQRLLVGEDYKQPEPLEKVHQKDIKTKGGRS